ncbi:MAG: restriction endonuclease subunit S [Bacteroidales bacterium]|nr:restriction endonuclease subunit S [Bacteroidales bacterium]
MDKLCKEFLLYKIAKLDNGNKFDKNKMTHDNPCYNFVSRTATNNGISDFVDDNGTKPYPAGTITLAFGGSIGSTFIQPKPYYTGQNVGVITLPDGVSEEAKLYFAISLEKMCKCKYVAFADEINKHFKTDLTVVLPVIENPNPDHEYTVDDIDWQYMRDRITELERDRITELDAYLQATGLNDYELTEDDKKILSLSAKRASDENGTLEDNSEDEVKFGEIKVSKLFDIHPTSAYKMSNFDLFATIGDTPVLSNSSMNNGIGGYSALKPTENGDMITFSDTTTGTDTIFYQSNPFIGYAHVQGMYPLQDGWSEASYKYFIGALKKAAGNGWNYAVKFNRKLVADMDVLLPIKSDGTPDFDYMERYIRAMEKVVIADVVKYKNKVIETTKKVVGD